MYLFHFKMALFAATSRWALTNFLVAFSHCSGPSDTPTMSLWHCSQVPNSEVCAQTRYYAFLVIHIITTTIHSIPYENGPSIPCNQFIHGQARIVTVVEQINYLFLGTIRKTIIYSVHAFHESIQWEWMNDEKLK